MPSCQQLLAFTSILYVVNASLQLSFTRERRSSPPSLQRRHRLRRDSVEAPLQNAQTDTLYLVNVTIGSPSQNMMLQLDTGSRDIWVPWSDSDICSGRSNPCTNGAFNPSDSTTFDDVAPDLFHVAYVDGTEIVGDYFRDTFGIGGISVENQTMGIAKDAIINDLSVPFQGIVGVGPGAGEAVDGQADTYPNLISMLRSQGHTDSQAYSLWLNDLGKFTLRIDAIWSMWQSLQGSGHAHYAQNRALGPFCLVRSIMPNLMVISLPCPFNLTSTLTLPLRLRSCWIISTSNLDLGKSSTRKAIKQCQ